MNLFYDEKRILQKIDAEKKKFSDEDKYCLINDAIMFDSINVLDALLKNNCFVYKIENEPSVYELCILRQNMDAFRKLNDYNILKNFPEDGSLVIAVMLNLPISVVEEVCNAVADINVIGCREGTAVDWAVQNKNNDLLRFLIEKGADLSIKTDFQNNLCLATADGNFEAVKTLVANGMDVNGSLDDVPLMLALHYEFYYIADYLLSCGADVDKQDDEGRTTLHHCVITDEKHKINYLLKHGADINIKDNRGITPQFLLEDVDLRNQLYYELYEVLDNEG